MTSTKSASLIRSDGQRRIDFDETAGGLFYFSESRWIVFDNTDIEPGWNVGEDSGLYDSLDAAIASARNAIPWFDAEFDR